MTTAVNKRTQRSDKWRDKCAAFEARRETYPLLSKYAKVLLPPVREIVGRDLERDQILASLARPELSNVILLAPAGSGKTALVQATSEADEARVYLEVDVSLIIADVRTSADEMAATLKALFDEAERYAMEEDQELVLFFDEAHQIVQLSAAAVEALKPILAASGARGILVIMATTFEEYFQYIAPNQPLVERLQRINLTPPDSETTVRILRGMAEQYGVGDYFYNDSLFKEIVALTNLHVPQSMQPRKSIRVLDAMVGWHRVKGMPMDIHLLADVLYESTGININFKADGTSIKETLDAAVFAQDLATSVVARRLQICVAGLQNRSRPQASFLFAGSTGVGKTELVKQFSKVMFGDDGGRLIRFDMSEYAEASSLSQFQSLLTREVASYGNAIVLLDEIEKADEVINRLLYQVLDDGRLTDDNGRQVSFLSTYIVMTTNMGSTAFAKIGEYEASESGDGESMQDYMRTIQSTMREEGFPEALLGRIDEIVPFQPLHRETVRKIVRRKLENLVVSVWQRHNVKLELEDRVLTYVVDDIAGLQTKDGGAREALRSVDKEITSKVAEFINENPGETRIRMFIEGDMRVENKTQRRTKAYPVVEPMV